MIVDAHAHLWTADYPWLAADEYTPLRRDVGVEDLRLTLAAAGVDAGVLIESGLGDGSETTRLLELAADTREVVGVVGWAPLTDPGVGDIVGKHRADRGGPMLVGVRDHVRQRPDDFLDRVDVRAGLRAVAANGLVNELAVRTDQLPSVARAAAALPDVVFVLDHLGSPWVSEGDEGLAEWLNLIRPVAACPNVVAKLSGLITLAQWDRWVLDDVRPYVDSSLDLFGTARLMYGSDWPFCELAAPYERVMNALVSLLGGLPVNVFATTAIGTYQLEIDDYHRTQ